MSFGWSKHDAHIDIYQKLHPKIFWHIVSPALFVDLNGLSVDSLDFEKSASKSMENIRHMIVHQLFTTWKLVTIHQMRGKFNFKRSNAFQYLRICGRRYFACEKWKSQFYVGFECSFIYVTIELHTRITINAQATGECQSSTCYAILYTNHVQLCMRAAIANEMSHLKKHCNYKLSSPQRRNETFIC